MTATEGLVKHYCTTEEAIKFIKRRGWNIRVCASVELPLADDPNRCFPGYASIAVTRKDAIGFVRSVLDGFEKRGARIRVEEWPKGNGRITNTLFIG